MEHLVQYKIEAIDKITGVYRTLIGLQDKAAGKTAATNSATAKANKAMNQLAKTTTSTGEKMSNSMKYAVLRFQRTKKTIDDTERSIKKTGSSLDWLKGKVGGVERRFSVMGGRIKGALGKITDTLGGFGTTMAGIFTLDMIKGAFDTFTSAASDLNESTNKAKVVFGSNFGEINKFAESSATALGMSKKEAFEATSTLADMFQGMGMGSDKSTDFSKRLVKLSADLGSFHNMSNEDALAAISSGMRGEMEPLTRVGVVLNDATLKQKAFEMGLISSTKKAMTPAIKAEATYQALMEKTTRAQGDRARTSGDLAGREKTLAALQVNMQANLGAKLLPLKLKFVNLLIKVTEWVDKNADKLIYWGEKVAIVGGALLGLFIAAKTIIGVAAFYSTVTTAITLLRNSTMLATIASKAFTLAARVSPFGWIAAVITGIILLVRNWDTVKVYLAKFAKWAWENHPFKWMIDLVDRIFPGFKSSLSNMFESIKSVFLKVVDWVYDNVLKPLFGWLGDLIDGFSFSPTVAPQKIGRGGMGEFADRNKKDNTTLNLEPTGNDLGIKANNESLVSGGGKEIKNINIRIDKLIESFNISTQTFGASTAQIKSEVQKILLSAVNEVNYQ